MRHFAFAFALTTIALTACDHGSRGGQGESCTENADCAKGMGCVDERCRLDKRAEPAATGSEANTPTPASPTGASAGAPDPEPDPDPVPEADPDPAPERVPRTTAPPPDPRPDDEPPSTPELERRPTG